MIRVEPINKKIPYKFAIKDVKNQIKVIVTNI